MNVLDRTTFLWSYLPTEAKGLINDGEVLLGYSERIKENISDYSYLVFPFAKAYEGFLKKLLLDLKLIREDMYYGDSVRIGRILNPHFIREHDNVYKGLSSIVDGDITVAENLWTVWIKARNQVFHYFPHNFRKLTYVESKELIDDLVSAMHTAVNSCNL